MLCNCVFLISFRFKTLSIDFTHYHRESGLFVCVSVQLVWAESQKVTPSLSIYPLFIPSFFSGLDLQVALTVKLNRFLFKEKKKSITY